MWTLVTALLLSSLCSGSAQILFNNIESVTVRDCAKDVVIPCHATNMQPEGLEELYLTWFFGKTFIFSFNGLENKYNKIPAFQSGRISTSAFLKGDASLTLDKNEAKAGNYTCVVTELSREGKQRVELKYNCSSAQILFNNIESVTVRDCAKDVVIPCHATNMQPEGLEDLYLTWFFGKTFIFSFSGLENKYNKIPAFQSGRISTSAFLKGDASLTLDKNEAKAGTYTCVVTELSREGKQRVELKYNCRASWFSLRECILIIIFPFLTSLLFWAQFAILMQKYKSNLINKKTIVLSTSGLLFTIVVIVGALLFIPGNYSEKKSFGLILLVTPSVIPVVLQYHKFMPAIGRTFHAMITLTVIQALGFALVMAGVYLTVNERSPKYGSLLISGLIIVTLVELLGLIYMKWLDPLRGLNET